MNDLDSTFIYVYESLELKHAWDDFSLNKFPKDADYTDGGVTSELFYRLMDETNTTPLDPALIFCDSLYAHHDTVKLTTGVEVTTESHYPFTPYDIWINDLDFYPVEGELKENVFQECYILVDSIIDGVLDPDQDTLWFNHEGGPAYVQDSARVFTKTVTDTSTLWMDEYAYHNYTFAYQPWSLGVATLDGVDENGWPYAFGDDGAHGVADYLTSRPIDLSVATAGEDVVYLSFIYQPEGHGNMPENIDSLLVDFYNPADETWSTQLFYATGDNSTADQWDTARFTVPTFLFVDGFQFRFKNYASLSGALDHWHIDYVNLEISVETEITSFNDVAITEPINTILKDYTAVPWDHYKNNTSGNEHILPDLKMYVFNNTPSGTNFTNGDWEVRYEGVLQGGSPFNIPNTASPTVNFDVGLTECTFDGAGDYFYDPGIGGDQAAFDLKFSFTSAAGPGKNIYKTNDTTRFTQDFRNYYAYDDGSAEAAYGIDGTGSLMAYKFEAYEAGVLTGILMSFVPSVTDLSGEVFLLTVWADDGGQPGEIIYQDDYFQSHSPEYSGAQNGFRYYEFTNSDYVFYEDIYKPEGEHEDTVRKEALLNVGEVFYVGWQNIGSASLNVGMDANMDSGEKIFRNTTGSWLTSSYDISLMIRPVFYTGINATLSVDETIEEDKEEITLYPNPTSDMFYLSGLSGNFTLSIYDMSGRMVTSLQNEHQVDVNDLEKGVYIVDVRDEFGNPIYSSRLIKR